MILDPVEVCEFGCDSRVMMVYIRVQRLLSHKVYQLFVCGLCQEHSVISTSSLFYIFVKYDR